MYVGIGPEKDTVVTDDQAFDYALERCLHGTPDDQKEFKEMLVEMVLLRELGKGRKRGNLCLKAMKK